MDPNDVTFKLIDVEGDITKRVELLYKGNETGMIVEIKNFNGYRVEAYLWLRMKDMVIDVQPHMIYFKEGGNTKRLEDYIRKEFRSIVAACEDAVDMLRADIETSDCRFEKINKLLNEED